MSTPKSTSAESPTCVTAFDLLPEVCGRRSRSSARPREGFDLLPEVRRRRQPRTERRPLDPAGHCRSRRSGSGHGRPHGHRRRQRAPLSDQGPGAWYSSRWTHRPHSCRSRIRLRRPPEGCSSPAKTRPESPVAAATLCWSKRAIAAIQASLSRSRAIRLLPFR